MLRPLTAALAAASLGAALTLAAQAPAGAAPPLNNDFASATAIPPAGGVLNSTGVEATVEPGEPSPSCAFAGVSAKNTTWFKLPAGNYAATLTTSGDANGDTVMAVYTGSALDALTQVACNDDVNASNFYSSLVYDTSLGAETYVQVSWWGNPNPAPKAFTLTATLVPLQPHNDDFANAEEIPASGGAIPGTGVAGTREVGEPDAQACSIGAGVSQHTTWYRLPAGINDVTLTTSGGAGGDTLLAVYRGAAVGSLTPQVCDDDAGDGNYSTVTLRTNGASDYYVQVGWWGNPTAAPTLFTLTAVVTPLLCNGEQVTVDLSLGQVPTTSNDVIYGTAGDDTIDALAGDDVVCALGGIDLVHGRDGADRLFGGLGDDHLNGEGGADTLGGGAGSDQLTGGPLVDRLNGDAGNDFLNGDAGADELFGQGDNDVLEGNDGNDKLNGGSGDDNLLGGPHADTLVGDAGGDYLEGADGGDQLNGGAGFDELNGGLGNDVLNGGTDADWFEGGDGADRLVGGAEAENMFGDAGNDYILGAGGNDVITAGAGADRVVAGDGNDEVHGNEDNDALYGSAGNDQLFGDDGDDHLHGQDGDDTLEGGAGADILAGGPGVDVENQ